MNSAARPGYVAQPRYAGLVTRFVAFVIDAAILALIALVVVGSVSLALSMFGKSIDDLPTAIGVIFGVGGWIVLNVVYFVGSWSLTGKTIGQHVMRLRVQRDGADGGSRCGAGSSGSSAVVLAAIPLFCRLSCRS